MPRITKARIRAAMVHFEACEPSLEVFDLKGPKAVLTEAAYAQDNWLYLKLGTDLPAILQDNGFHYEAQYLIDYQEVYGYSSSCNYEVGFVADSIRACWKDIAWALVKLAGV